MIIQNKHGFRPDPKAKLMDQVKEVLRCHHYAYCTEVAYCQWMIRGSTNMEEKPTRGKWADNKLKPFCPI